MTVAPTTLNEMRSILIQIRQDINAVKSRLDDIGDELVTEEDNKTMDQAEDDLRQGRTRILN